MPKKKFNDFHRLLGEAARLIESFTIDESDTALMAKQNYVLHSLLDAQKQALIFERAVRPTINFPVKRKPVPPGEKTD